MCSLCKSNSTIKQMCEEKTSLNDKEIEKIIEVLKTSDLMSNFYESDVLSFNKDEAYVVAHGKPQYQSTMKML